MVSGVYLFSVVHESVSGFQAYPVFSLAAPGKEVSLGKVVSSS